MLAVFDLSTQGKSLKISDIRSLLNCFLVAPIQVLFSSEKGRSCVLFRVLNFGRAFVTMLLILEVKRDVSVLRILKFIQLHWNLILRGVHLIIN